MKQFLTEEQTAVLRELGCQKPKGTIVTDELQLAILPTINPNYSLGELIEIVSVEPGFRIDHDSTWIANVSLRLAVNDELIDALYDIIVALKIKA